MDENMVRQAQCNLRDFQNLQVMQSDIASVRLPVQVDVIFSNAVLHWIADHEKVFAHFAGLLKEGGELIAQRGGQGNQENALAVVEGGYGRRSVQGTFCRMEKSMALCGA